MNEIGDWLIPLLTLALGGGGVGAIIQARTSRRVGVREQDVVADKNSGDLALELTQSLFSQIQVLEAARTADRAQMTEQSHRISRFEGMLEGLRRTVSEAVGAIDDVIAWEAEGAQPPPPWRLADIRTRLSRAITTKETE